MQKWERTQKGFRFGNHFPLFCVVVYWGLLWHFRRAHSDIVASHPFYFYICLPLLSSKFFYSRISGTFLFHYLFRRLYWGLLWHFRRAHTSITSIFVFTFVVIFFLEYDVSFTCFSLRCDCAFIFSQNGHFGQCVWDGEWEELAWFTKLLVWDGDSRSCLWIQCVTF